MRMNEIFSFILPFSVFFQKVEKRENVSVFSQKNEKRENELFHSFFFAVSLHVFSKKKKGKSENE